MRSIAKASWLVAFVIVLSGCTMTMGNIGDKTHFAYPNSNIEPLGEVSSSLSKTGIFIPPTITQADIKKLMEDALVQKPGSDLLINYKLDTSFTMVPIPPYFYFMNVYLKGTASKMTVGLKELKEMKSVY